MSILAQDLPAGLFPVLFAPMPEKIKCAKLVGSAQREHRRLSYSGNNTLFSCPRKYQLIRALPFVRDVSIHTAFGSAFGAGVQSYLVHQDVNRAIVSALAAWDMPLYANDAKSNKSFASCALFIEKWAVTYGNQLLQEYEVLTVGGKPAVELHGCFEFPNDFKYRMYVDAVLKDKKSGELLVLEIKTRGSVTDPADYVMSDQGLGYAVLVDALARQLNLPSSFAVAYMVLESKSGEIAYFPFPKSSDDRVLWIKHQLAIAETIEVFGQLSVWPTRGNACRAWGRTCSYLGACTKEYLIPSDFGTALPHEEEYDFICSINHALETQFDVSLREERNGYFPVDTY